MGKPFSKQEDEIIRDLAELRLTSRQIGEKLGRTRNAIIGRCHRIGIKLHKQPPTGGARRRRPRITKELLTPKPMLPEYHKTAPEPVKVLARPKPKPTVKPPEEGYDKVPLLTLSDKMCHYIVTDFRPYLYCARPVEANPDHRPYCGKHNKSITQPRRPR